MDGYDASTYGDRFADVYDEWYVDVTDAPACVATIAELAELNRDIWAFLPRLAGHVASGEAGSRPGGAKSAPPQAG